MKKISSLLLLAAANLAFSQYMIVGKDSVSLQDFKKDNLYGLQNAGIEKTLKNTQDFLLLQQLAAEKKADTMMAFQQKVGQKLGQLREEKFFPPQMMDVVVQDYVNANKTERNLLIFTVEKTADDKTDYQKVYNDVVSGKLSMENAIKTYVKKDVQPFYLKPGVMPTEVYDEVMKLQPGQYSKLYNMTGAATFIKVVSTRPSLGYLVFGTLSYPKDANSETRKNEILAAFKEGKKFHEVAKLYGSNDNEKNNGGAVMGSPTLPDDVYNALKTKKAGEHTTEPILIADNYFFFNMYQLTPYELNEKTKSLFKREMMESTYRQKLEELLAESLKKSGSYKENPNFSTIKKSYAALNSFKDDRALLYQYNKHSLTIGDLKKQLAEQYKDLDKISAKDWADLMDMRRDMFVISSYSKDFEFIPEIKKELDSQRRMGYSEYIFTEYLKKEIEKNPQWITDYYNKNKSKYMWEERAQARVAIIADDKLTTEVKKLIKDEKNWEILKKKYDGQLNSKNQVLVHFEEGKMSNTAEVFVKNNVPFAKGVHTTKLGDRTVVIAVDALIPQTQMTEKEAYDMLFDAVSDEFLQQTIAQQRAKTKIVVEPAFIKDLEANFKK